MSAVSVADPKVESLERLAQAELVKALEHAEVAVRYLARIDGPKSRDLVHLISDAQDSVGVLQGVESALYNSARYSEPVEYIR